MGKVNIGLRGWRFDEEVVFDEDGQVRSLDSMDPDTRDRLLRLASRIGDPCDCCWLQAEEGEIEEPQTAEVIYGEPRGEVVLCGYHEHDFVYWFREVADEDLIGTTDLADAFHEWYLGGGRAPSEYPVLEHVEGEESEAPESEDLSEEMPGLGNELDDVDEEDLEALDVDLSDLDV